MMKKNLSVILIFPVFLLVWELIDYVFGIKEIILPNPHEIFFAIVNNFKELLYHTSITGAEALIGFFIGLLLSLTIAVVFVSFSSVKKTLYPYVIIVQATPIIVFAPLLVLWFGNDMASKIVMAALISFFPILVNAAKGFTAVDTEVLDLFSSLCASKWQIFRKLRLPNALPYLFPALKISITFAVAGAVIAEFTGASKGIGHLIVNSSYYLDTSLLFAGIVMISLTGILFFYIVDFIEKKVVFWQKHE